MSKNNIYYLFHWLIINYNLKCKCKKKLYKMNQNIKKNHLKSFNYYIKKSFSNMLFFNNAIINFKKDN